MLWSVVDYYTCAHPPVDHNWYRFWVKVYTGTTTCNSSYVLQPRNSWHEADIQRDPNNNNNWILHWNGSTWTTLTGSKTSRLALADMERVADNDSGYAEYYGAQYMTTDQVWHSWGTVTNYYDCDTDYDLVTGTSADHFYVKKTNSNYTNC